MSSDVISKAVDRRRRARRIAFAATMVAAIGFAAIAGAWFFQLVLGILPCQLCLEQRYAYYVGVPLAALIALGGARGAPRSVLGGGLILLALIVFANAGLGAYHAGVEWGLWQGPTECSGPLTNFGDPSRLLESLKTLKVVRCDEVQWRFLGLSLAGYNVLISALMGMIALWGLRRTKPAR